MSYNHIQQNAFGRYFDSANEMGGHGGDSPAHDYDEPVRYMRAQGLNEYQKQVLRAQGHDVDVDHATDCCCPTCIVRAMRDFD